MADEGIKIDATVFHDRLSSFQLQWKNDKRSGDAIFKGAGSIIILLGKAEDDVNYRKNNAFEVRFSPLRSNTTVDYIDRVYMTGADA